MKPTLPIELKEFIEDGLSVAVATAGSGLLPECVRAVGTLVHPDRRHLTAFLPVMTSARIIPHLEQSRRIAVALSEPETHRAIQLKGGVVGIRAATDADRVCVERSFERFVDHLAVAGVPRATARRMVRWPCWAVEMEIRDVFLQTPGPRAGCRLPSDD